MSPAPVCFGGANLLATLYGLWNIVEVYNYDYTETGATCQHIHTNTTNRLKRHDLKQHESINLLIQLCFQGMRFSFLVISVHLFCCALEDQVYLRSIENGERVYCVLFFIISRL